MPDMTATELRARAAADLAAAEQLDNRKQLGEADLAGMTPHQIDAARVAGQLDDLLRGDDQ